ncbi:MAG: aspartate aminotransferase family protein [Candidatus Methylacidiphilales bacterium]|nr:aspartate aminotransferase family protein [Candidatus Methylacidiphilales bacterium]
MLPEILSGIPGPRSLDLARRLRAHESPNVTFLSPKFPVFWERAEGANVWDVDGNRFLDVTSGFGVATAGYGRTELAAALGGQAAQLNHGMGDVHPTELKVRVCEGLSRVTFERWGLGSGKVLLGNSGFEAVEAALKTAALVTGRPRVIAFRSGYHGLGFGSLAVTGLEAFQSPFRQQLADLAEWAPFPAKAAEMPDAIHAVEALSRRRDIGAILVEPIQGRGGEIIPPKGFLPELRRIADAAGILLIYDEIYTGFFRTGRFFACEYEKVYPDLICLGKALTGCLPVSACVGRASVMDAWPVSTGEALHTSTFLGSPLGMRAVLESLAFWEQPGRDNEARLAEARWCEALAPLMASAKVREIRGRGLLWGVELKRKVAAGKLMESCLAEGLIVLGGGPLGNVLSLSPPLVMTPEQVAWAGQCLGRSLRVAG